MKQGPDSALIDSDAPLDQRTSAFLDRNANVFTLLHNAAANDQPDWIGAPADPAHLDPMFHQLSGVRLLCQMGILRARLLAKNNQPTQAVEQLLDLLALARNVDRAHPIMISSLVAIAVEQNAMNELAVQLPALPKDLVARLPDQLKQLPPVVTFSDLIGGEQQFGAGMLASELKPPLAQDAFAAMSPFYTAVKKASEESPPLSAADFTRKITDAVSTINGKDPQVSRTLAMTLIPSVVPFYASYCTHVAHRAMLDAAIVVVRDGPESIKSSVDPFGDGPFELTRTANGFELQSKLLDRNDKPVTMRFGK